jgi:truncated hemoglobin YjbI
VDGAELYRSIGGREGCLQLSTAFYGRVKRDPVLRPFFPGKTLRCAIEELAAFLAQLLGGPSEDAQFRWSLSLRESHLRFRIGARERDAWMTNMRETLEDAPIQEAARSALRSFFERSSAYLVNTGPAPQATGDGNGTAIQQEVSRRWTAQLALDEALAAVRGGAADRAIALAEGSPLREHFAHNRSVHAALLARMLAGGDAVMLAYVRERLQADPPLAAERYSGRTLLHAAAAAGNPVMVKLLLDLGAPADVTDGGGHTPLHCLANECKPPGGGDIVRALVQAGANVDSRDRAKHCTALHVAARRGNVEVAEALLDCGASIDPKDSLGDTPLRRAVNCGKTGVAALLVARGADVHSKGNKGLTPLLAARTTAARQLFAKA